MKIDIVTIFPEIAKGPLNESIMKRAQQAGKVVIDFHDLRDYTTDKHRQVDDLPYGGGPGMVMKPEPFFEAVDALKTDASKVLMMTPQGKPFVQKKAQKLSEEKHLIILCGHYEGVDNRVTEVLVDEEISIGDYVLTNGTIAATIVVDAITRLLPGVLGDDASSEVETFSGEKGYLEAPQYTRPATYRGIDVPEVLLSGHHQKIQEWRSKESLRKTKAVRPDLFD